MPQFVPYLPSILPPPAEGWLPSSHMVKSQKNPFLHQPQISGLVNPPEGRKDPQPPPWKKGCHQAACRWSFGRGDAPEKASRLLLQSRTPNGSGTPAWSENNLQSVTPVPRGSKSRTQDTSFLFGDSIWRGFSTTAVTLAALKCGCFSSCGCEYPVFCMRLVGSLGAVLPFPGGE